MELFSYNGQLVHSQSITNVQMELPIWGLEKGNYYVKAMNNLGTITKKVIVQ